MLILDKFYKNIKVKISNDSEKSKKIEGYCGFALKEKMSNYLNEKTHTISK